MESQNLGNTPGFSWGFSEIGGEISDPKAHARARLRLEIPTVMGVL
jgi:hypothetical protein